MIRPLLGPALALATTLAGCTTPEPGKGAHAVPDHAGSATPAAMPAAPDPGAAAPAPQGTDAAGAPAAAPPENVDPAAKDGVPAGGGRMAKPGWCAQDADCPGGQICEECKGEKCCTLGCRSDAGCSKGQHCKPVMCVRAPCPSVCQ